MKQRVSTKSGFALERGRMPWIIRVYLILVFTFAALLILGVAIPSLMEFLSTMLKLPRAVGSSPFTQLIKIAEDGLKVALGALIGSLSMAANIMFTPPSEPKREISSMEEEPRKNNNRKPI